MALGGALMTWLRYVPHMIAGAAILGALWWVYAIRAENTRLTDANALLRANIAACNARNLDLQKDKDSDATVTDPGTFPVPDGWLLPD